MKKMGMVGFLTIAGVLVFLNGCSAFNTASNIVPGQTDISSDFHAKVVRIMADVERIRGLRLLHPIKYYIILDDEARKMGLEKTEKTKAFYTDNAVYFLKKNLTGDWDILAAHEFIHALQDQNFGLGKIKIPENDRDTSLAIEGLIEGDAVYTMILYAMEKEKPAVSKMIENSSIVGRRGIFPMQTALKYKFGARFVEFLKKMGGWGAVNVAFTKYPPTGTFYLLHPEKYIMMQNVNLPEILMATENIASVDTYGEIDLLYYLLETGISEAMAKSAVNGWAGGVVIKTKSSETVTIIKWENKNKLKEFSDIFSDAMNKKYGVAVKAEDDIFMWQTEKSILSLKINHINDSTTISRNSRKNL